MNDVLSKVSKCLQPDDEDTENQKNNVIIPESRF